MTRASHRRQHAPPAAASRSVGTWGAVAPYQGEHCVLTLSLTLSLSVARYVDAVAPYLAEHGVRTVFLATDSEEVLPPALTLTPHVLP